jgi:vancomycin permeability regulator SanA
MAAGLRRRALRIAGALAIAAAAGVVGPNVWVSAATRGRVFADVASAPARSVAIVPGARVYGGRPFVHLEARLQAALSLYRSGQVKVILVSGNDTETSPEVTAMRDWLNERGVPARDVIADEGGSRTRETMNRAVGLFDVRDAILCTQDVSAARSLYLADQAGIDAIAVALPSTLSKSKRFMGNEALKTSLAFVESRVRRGASALAGERARRDALAAR